jgi:hypothetical protein
MIFLAKNKEAKMAILSFAHLKNKKNPEEDIVSKNPAAFSSGSVIANRGPTIENRKTAVMSFAHMKSIKTVTQAKEAVAISSSTPKLSKIPIVMPTALLIATNHCSGCGRFGRSSEKEKSMGNEYGMCLRSIEINDAGQDIENWQVIPAQATVSRCFFCNKP